MKIVLRFFKDKYATAFANYENLHIPQKGGCVFIEDTNYRVVDIFYSYPEKEDFMFVDVLVTEEEY